MTKTDKIAPKLKLSTPKSTDNGVELDKNLVFTFNEKVKAGTGKITLSTDGDSREIPVTNKQIQLNTLTIDPDKDLLPNKHYTIKFPSTAIADLANNKYAGTTFSFDTKDTLAPQLKFSTPGNGYKSISTDRNIELVFNEKIKVGTGKIIFNDNAGNILTIPTNDSQVTIKDSKLTVNLTDNLKASSTYSVKVTADAVQDLAGNSFTGNGDGFKFSTKYAVVTDKIAPVLVESSPINNAQNIAIDSDLTLIFNEAIKTGIGDIVISDGTKYNKIPLTDSKQVTVNNNILTINPTTDLLENKNYSIQIADGVIADKAGNKFAAKTLNFSSHDSQPPTLISASPSDDSSSVLATSNIVLTFSEAVQVGSGDIVISNGTTYTKISIADRSQVTINKNIVTINPSVDFVAGNNYSVQIASGVIKDAAGNAFAGINETTAFNFSTIENVPPKIENLPPKLVSITPADDSLNIAKDSNIVLTFDENVVAGKGNFVISNGSDTRTISVTDAQVGINGKVVTINPTTDLESGKGYNVLIDKGALKDSANNDFAGISDITVLNFKTTDSSLTGKAVDGYLAGATVFADANGNGVLDAGEATATTEKGGSFKLTNGNGAIVVSGGTDESTGKAFKGTLKAPEGSTAITPLTTLQQGFVEQGLTVDDAEKAVAKAFGFDATQVDLKSYDPISSLTTASTADKALATNLMASAAKIANFLVTAGEVLQGAGGDKVTTEKSGDALLKSLVSAITSDKDGIIDLADKTLLTSILNDSAKEVTKTVTGTTANFEAKIAKMADTVASVIKDATDNISAVITTGGNTTDLLASMANVSKFTQEGAASQLQDAAKTFDPNSATALTSLASLGTTLTGTSADNSIKVGSETPITTSVTPTTKTPDLTPTYTTPADIISPTLSSSTPANNATNVEISSNIVLTFSEAIQAGSSNVTITNTIDPTHTVSISTAVSGWTATISPTGLEKGYSYSVTIPAGIVKDLAGNAYATSATKTFTTAANGTFASPVTSQTTGNDVINGNQSAVGSSAVAFDTGTNKGNDTYVFQLDSSNGITSTYDANVTITGFGAGDKLIFNTTATSSATGATATTALDGLNLYGINDNPAGTIEITGIGTSNHLQEIVLLGLTGSRAAVGGSIDSFAELNTFLGNSAIEII